jgi:hypothetical protein
MNFKVGEIAIITFSVVPEFPIGTEVTILGFGERGLPEGCQYLIYRRGRTRYFANDYCLKRKDPPADREPLGSWNECPWQPKALTHEVA